jgi:ectoine hydroxylase-related dioxygenase (phytanoyl-CoA dioxygenase family)
MDKNALREELDRRGFVVVRNLLSPEEVKFYTGKMEELSGISRADAEKVDKSGGLGQRGLDKSWNLPDGVTKSRDFWPLIWNETLLDTARALLGNDDVRYMQHSDLHVGFSAISWHRDNVNRQLGQGPDWDESEEPYKILRVGVYLQTYEESHFRLGFIPGSHRPVENITFGRKMMEARLKWVGAMSYMFVKLQELASSEAEWVATEPGDCILFDPRTIHSGSYIVGPKYSMFVAYGIENKHFFNHFNYYQRIRPELGYQEMNPELVQELRARNLYPENQPEIDEIEGAYVPVSIMRNIVSRRVKETTGEIAANGDNLSAGD